MSEERKKILQMLADGKITAEEADRLLAAVDNQSSSGAAVSIATTSKKQIGRAHV